MARMKRNGGDEPFLRNSEGLMEGERVHVKPNVFRNVVRDGTPLRKDYQILLWGGMNYSTLGRECVVSVRAFQW